VITGGVVSRTVTVKLPVALFPAASVAPQLTVVAWIANVEPDAGLHDGLTLPSWSSLAVAV
jgi:hypothetical protein